MAPLQELMGRFYLSSSTNSINVAAVGGYLYVGMPAGYYYYAGYAGEPAGQVTNIFLNDMQNSIRTLTGVMVNFSYNVTNGCTTMVADQAVNIKIDFAMANVLGMAVTQVGEKASIVLTTTPVCSIRQPRYSWRPSRGMSDYPTTSDAVVAPRSTTLTGRSKDGTTFSVGGNLLYDARLKWSHLSNSEVLTPSNGTSFTDLQQWWTDVVHAGQPFRVIADRATYATNKAFAECLVGDPSGEEPREVGSFTDLAGRRVKSWNGLWDVDLEVVKEVG